METSEQIGVALQSRPTYQSAGQQAQQNCPHAVLNRAGNECSTCGSIKQNGRWAYLSLEWFRYYTSGQDRPA